MTDAREYLESIRKTELRLQMKKQQLQIVIMRIEAELEREEAELVKMMKGFYDWVAVFAENRSFEEGKRLENLVRPASVVCGEDNIAGVKIPVFRELTFHTIEYEIEDYPLWVDTAVIRLREIARLDAVVKVTRQQLELLHKELRTTSQRVNLFEKVKIPETKENIRIIGIYLGNEQTTAVVRGKIAKKKLQEARR